MTTKPLIIGLTGGIASGKSQVSQLFSEKKVNIVDADKIARALFDPNSPHLEPVRKRFGSDIFDSDGQLDRKALGALVFADNKQLKWLNDFTHPLVNQEMKRQISKAISDYVILDIPLLVDLSGKIPEHLANLVDRVLVVSVLPETQLERVIDRDNVDVELAKKILGSQSSLQQKLAVADDVIDNNGQLSDLNDQVDRLAQKYSELANSN
jgi:dephospho-CoA kinase